MIPVIVPAKNEEKNLKTTIVSLRETASYAEEELFIVVIDDGSKDNTAKIAKDLACHLVRLPDRGYSALGKPELADTHNAGFKFIDENIDLNSYKYLMVVGADTTFDIDYLYLLKDEMERRDNLVLCAGVLSGLIANDDAVRGTGRLIRNSFWTVVGRKLPNMFHSWESYPVVFALAYGYKAGTISTAKMDTPRVPMETVDWKRYGIGMRENGSLLIYVLLRALKRLLKAKDFIGFYRLVYGYLSSKPNLYDKKLRDFNANRQLRKLFGLGQKKP